MTGRNWTIYEDNGRIVGTLTGPRTEAEAVEADSAGRKAIQTRQGAVTGATHYVEDGEVLPRPATGLPETHEVPANEDWQPSPVPNGTKVTIDGQAQSELTHAGLILSFPEPGTYVVRLDPPFPWKLAICTVTVT